MLHGERVVPRRRPRAIRPKDRRSRRAATSSVTATSGSGHEPRYRDLRPRSPAEPQAYPLGRAPFRWGSRCDDLCVTVPSLS